MDRNRLYYANVGGLNEKHLRESLLIMHTVNARCRNQYRPRIPTFAGIGLQYQLLNKAYVRIIQYTMNNVHASVKLMTNCKFNQ